MGYQPQNSDEENPYESHEYIPYVHEESKQATKPSSNEPDTKEDEISGTHFRDDRKALTTKQNFSLRLVALVGIVVLLIVASLSGIYAITVVAQNKAHTEATVTTSQNATHAATTATVIQTHVTATAQVRATATAYAALNPYPAYPVVSMNDPLNGMSVYHWFVGTSEDQTRHWKGNCTFTANSYSVSASYSTDSKGLIDFMLCSASDTNYADFVFQAQMKIVKGDCGGLTLRGDSNDSQFYDFDVCQNGTYSLQRFKQTDYPNTALDMAAGSSSAIQRRLSDVNLIAVAAHGDTFELYINHQHVGAARNSEYKKGQIGLLAAPLSKNDTEVLYNNVQVWTPPITSALP